MLRGKQVYKKKMDEQSGGGKGCFELPSFPRKQTLGPPATGEEYLLQVRSEAQNCARVVVANHVSSPSSSPSMSFRYQKYFQFEKDPSQSPIHQDLIPHPNWQTQFIQQYEVTHQKMQALVRQPTPTAIRAAIPKKASAKEWWSFCYFPADYPSLDVDGEEVKANTAFSGSEKESYFNSSFIPLPYLIAGLQQNEAIQLLQLHIEWMNVSVTTLIQTKWIYCLLSRLDKLLVADQVSILRDLCRICTAQRNQLKPPDNRIPPLNMIITIITHYYGQKDLTDLVIYKSGTLH